MADGSLPPLPPGAKWRTPTTELALPPLPPGANWVTPVTTGADVTAPASEPAPEPEQPSPFAALLAPLQSLANTGLEVGKGLGAGAVKSTAGLVTGAAKLDPFEAYGENIDVFRDDLLRVPSMAPAEVDALRQRVEATGTIASSQNLQTLISDLRDGSILPEELESQLGPRATPLTERRPYQAGGEMISWADRTLAADPTTPPVVRLGSEAVGSTLPYLLASILAPVAGPAIGAIGGSGEATRTAVEAGATPEQVTEASRSGMVSGATETLPFGMLGGNFFSNLPKLLRLPAELARQGTAEAAQEVLQTGIQNIGQSYDPNRPVTQGFGPAAAGGGIAGVVMEMFARMLGAPSGGGGVTPALPAPGPVGGTQVLPTGAESVAPTIPVAQPVPGPAPSAVAPVTAAAVLAANQARKAAEAQYPVGDPRRDAARENYIALTERFISERQAAAGPPTVLPVGPTPARPEGPAGALPAAVPPGPPVGAAEGTQVLPTNVPGPPVGAAEGTQVLPTNLPPASPVAPTGEEVAAPAPVEEGVPSPPPVAEPPRVAQPPDAVPAREPPTAPAALPAVPPRVTPAPAGGTAVPVPEGAPGPQAIPAPPAAKPPQASPQEPSELAVAQPAAQPATEPAQPTVPPAPQRPVEGGGTAVSAPEEQPAAPQPPPPGAETPALSPAAVEQVNALARRAQTIIDKNVPGRGIAAGSEGEPQAQRAEAIMSVVRGVRAGKTPDQAAAAAKVEIRKIIAAHNQRRPKEQHWGVDPAAYDREIDHAADMINRPPESRTKVQPTARRTSQVGKKVPARPPGSTEVIEVAGLVAESTPLGQNAAGEPLYDNPRGRFRIRRDRAERPEGYPDFGGDLAPVEEVPLAEQATGPAAEPRDKYGDMVPDGFTIEEVNRYLTNAENKLPAATDREVDYWETVAQPDQGLVSSMPGTSDLEPEPAFEEDIEEEPDEEVEPGEEVESESRVPRGGLTPTFQKASMATDTPLTERAAYTDAGLDPDEILTKSAPERIKALTDLFVDKFGFKTVSREGTYGQGKPLDVIDHLVDGYRGIRMMMHVLGLPQTGASLDGVVSLVLGRKTKRSAFLGAYDPTDQSIELVGRSNSFAHEWMHALDQWLMTEIDPAGKGMTSRWTRAKGLDPSVDLEGHFINVMNAIFFDDAHLATRVLDLQLKAGKTDKAGNPTKGAEEAQRLLDDIAAGRSQLINERSDTYKAAKRFGRGASYWTNPAEMLARSFEAYVAYKTSLIDPEFKSNFITKGDRAYLNTADQRLTETFPKAGDRARIFAVLDIMVGEVAARTSLSGDVAAAPTPNEILDDDAYYVHEARKADADRAKAQARGVVGRLSNQLEAIAYAATKEGRAEISDVDRATFGVKPDRLTVKQRLAASARAIFQSEAAVAEMVVNRPDNAAAKPYLQAVADQILEISPGGGRHLPETWSEAVIASVRKDSGRIENILKTHNIPVLVPLNPKSQKGQDARAQRERLFALMTTGKNPDASPDERKAAGALRKLLDEKHREATRAGLDIGYVEDQSYLPINLDYASIHMDEDGFREQAVKVYDLVFEEAVGDPAEWDALKKTIRDLDYGNRPAMRDPEIVALRKQQKSIAGKIRRLESQLTTSDDPDLVQAQIEEQTEKLQEVLDQLAEKIQPLWAELKAKQWHEAIIEGEVTTMDTRGPQTRHTKGRVLPAEAQEIMRDYYVSDPIDAIGLYLNSIARKTEYARRFGQQSGGRGDFQQLIDKDNSPLLAEMQAKGLDPTDAEDRVKAILTLTDPTQDNRLDMLMKEAQREKAVPSDMTSLREQVEHMTGQRRSMSGVYARGLSNVAYSIGTLALMPRAVFTSLVEPLTVMVRTGDVKATGATLAAGFQEIFRSKSTTVQDIRELSTMIGLVANEAQDQMLQATLGNGIESAAMQKLVGRFFERSLLAPLTRMQRRMTLAGFDVWLRKLMRVAQGTDPGSSAVAKADLAELGIPTEQIAQLSDFVTAGRTRFPTPTELRTDMGQLWAAAARRFTSSTIQEAGKGVKPRLASDPIGRQMYGLLSFAYSFTRNILVRTTRQVGRDVALRQHAGQSPAEAWAKSLGTNLGARMIGGFAALWLGQFLVGMFRELLFNTEQFDRHLKEGDFMEWMSTIALSRTGALGTLDPLVQAVKGITYQRDITSITAGPYVNVLLSFIQSAIMAGVNNSGNTNTAERNVARETTRTFLIPAIAYGLTRAPGGGLFAGALYAGGLWFGTSNQLGNIIATTLFGPREEKTGGRGQPGPALR